MAAHVSRRGFQAAEGNVRLEVAGSPSRLGRYFVLGISLAVLALMYPLLGHGLLGLGAWTAAFWLVLLGVLRASTTQGPARGLERALAILAAVGSLGTVAYHGLRPQAHGGLFALFVGLALAFLVIATIRILKSVLFGDHAKQDHLLAAACAYVLLGLFFAYSLIFLEGITGAEQVRVAPENLILHGDSLGLSRARLLYLSFITLTTLGYGDVTAITLEARMVLGVEAVIGQLYLAILVARLVGLHNSKETPSV